MQGIERLYIFQVISRRAKLVKRVFLDCKEAGSLPLNPAIDANFCRRIRELRLFDIKCTKSVVCHVVCFGKPNAISREFIKQAAGGFALIVV